MNPLLDFSGLPRFSEFKPDLVTPAVDQLLAENRALVERVAADPREPGWRDFVQPMEDANERLHRAWGVVGHLNAVMNSPELREAYNGNLPRVTQYYTELGQHEGLFAKFKALRASAGFPGLTPAQRRAITLDYGIRGASISIKVRRALLFYALKQLGLDVAPGARPAHEQHIVLLNRAEIEAARPAGAEP